MLRYYKRTLSTDIYHLYAQAGTSIESSTWCVLKETDDGLGNTSVKFAQKNGDENNGFVHAASTTNDEADILATVQSYTYGV